MPRARVADRVLVDAYRAGHSLEAISREWRIPERTVASRLRKIGVPIRPQGRPRRALTQALAEIAAMRARHDKEAV